MIRTLIFFLLMLVLPCVAHAQFFEFFGDPFFSTRPQQRQQREQVKAPEFKKGTDGIVAFQKKNFQTPEAVERRDGQVVVACIINEKGRVAETHIVRSFSKDYDKEAQRVCSKMKFRPAQRGKEKVKARYDITFPIRRGRLSFVTLQTVDI